MDEEKERYDNDIEIEIELSGAGGGKSPAGPAGRVIGVELEEEPARFMHNYSLSDTSRELAGVLLGCYSEKDGRYRVSVEAAIEARYTEAARGSVTFTHQTWDYINAARDERHPGSAVVGWFHTHPGFGIFLSGHDKFIHNNFFNLPFQVAYVIDPLAGKDGFFGWCEGSLDRVPFKSGLLVEPAPSQERVFAPAVVKKGFSFWPAAQVAAFVMLILGGGYFYLENREAGRQIAAQGEQIAGLEQSLSGLEGALAEREAALAALETDNLALQAALEEESPAAAGYDYYIVEAGDTLWAISEDHLGEGRRYHELAALNSITDPDTISAGQRLLLPER